MSYRVDSHSPINQAVKDLEERIASHKSESLNSSSSHPDPMEYFKMVFKGVEQPLRKVSKKLKDEAKKNPWSLLGKAAMGSLILGLIIGHHGSIRKKDKNE